MPRSLVRSRRVAAVAACVLSLLAAGCGDDPTSSPLEINFVGTWRGQPWQGTAESLLAADSLFVHGISRHRDSGPVQVAVRASVHFDGPGTYPLAAGAARVDYIVGGDVISESYASVASDDAVLIVREHANGVLTGRLTFRARQLSTPDESTAPEGRFDAEFVEAEVRG